MLFDRVVAKSRETITDKDILDLEDDDKLSNSNSSSPKETVEPAGDLANTQTAGQMQAIVQASANLAEKGGPGAACKDQEDLLALEMKLHAIQVKQVSSGSSPAVLQNIFRGQAPAAATNTVMSAN